MPAAAGKKLRKPYTIARPREKWTAEEHDRFLHAMLLFGRDWKRIEGCVGTKTTIQIRSHAQKHFLKAHKFGLAAGLPPPHPRRAALFHPPPTHPNNGAADTMPPPWTGGTMPISSIGCVAPSGVQHSMDWGCTPPESCWPNLDSQGHVHNPITPLIFPSECSFMGASNCNEQIGASSSGAWFVDASQDETIRLPLSPDDLHFAQVYRFVGDVFGSGAPRPVEAHLQRLQGMDPVVVETILLVLRNLEANLSA